MNVKCTQCGIAHNCNFCPNCGSSALPPPQGPSDNYRKKTSLSSGMKIIIPFLIVVVFIFYIGMFGSDSDPGEKDVLVKQSGFQLITGTTAEQEEGILKILKDCGISIKAIEHDEGLDDMNTEGETGYRISTEDVNNVILYLNLDKTVNIVRYANNNLYKDKTILSAINDYYVSYGEKLDLKSSCEKTIKELLKSPSTAKFPGASKWSMWKEEGLTYVQGYVDAQNSFGAELRSEFQFIIDGSTVVSLVFDGEEYVSSAEQNSKVPDEHLLLETVSYITPSITPAPTPLPTSTPAPRPTKPPTPTPKPEEDCSDWTLFKTNNYDLVRKGIWDGEVIYIEDDNYLVSPKYYSDVLEPYMDTLLELEKDFANAVPERENILSPDVEYEFIDDTEDNYDEEALQERIRYMIENELAVTGDE